MMAGADDIMRILPVSEPYKKVTFALGVVQAEKTTFGGHLRISSPTL